MLQLHHGGEAGWPGNQAFQYLLGIVLWITLWITLGELPRLRLQEKPRRAP